MKHVVSFSGGKDSTAMLLMMLEKGMPVDYILMCDTGKEFPQMYNHIKNVGGYIKERYNKEITILKSPKSFDYYMFDHVKTKGKHEGEKGYGWATMGIRWCTSNMKKQQIVKFYKTIDDEITEYIGIAYDEPKRIHEKKYPLYDWQITEAMALQYCYDNGFDWGGLYRDFKRVSCWCCPLKSLGELRVLYHKYPDLWKQLKDMDDRSCNQFRADYSVADLEIKFEKEDRQGTLF